MQDILRAIQIAGVFPVVEIHRIEDAVPVAKALRDGGIAAMEITLRTPVACEAIQAVLKAFPDMLVGAGTVLTPQQVGEVKAAGARFVVTPGFNPQVVSHCIDNNFLIIPGIDSPTGIELALEAGLQAVKFFPAEVRGGMEGLTSMSAPFKDRIKFLPLGGIGPHNITTYAKSDKVLAVGGTWLTKQKYIESGEFSQITQKAVEALALLHSFEIVGIDLNTPNTPESSALLHTIAMGFIRGDCLTASTISAPTSSAPKFSGQIRIACNNVHRAALWLNSRAVGGKWSEAGENGAESITLFQNVGGFSIQISEKQ